MPVAVELNGLLPGRGPGRGAPPRPGVGGAVGRGPVAAGLGSPGLGAPARPASCPGEPTCLAGRGACGPGPGCCGNGTGTVGPALRDGGCAAGGSVISAAAGGSAAGGLLSGTCTSGAGGACAATSCGPPASGLAACAARPFARWLAGAAGAAALPLAAWPSPACWLANASLSLRTTGASIVDDADRTNSPISWSLAITALLSTPNSLASSYTRTFATALPLLGPDLPDHLPAGAARAPSGVSLCCSSPHAHRALITMSAFFRSALAGKSAPPVWTARHGREVFRDLLGRQPFRQAQGTRESLTVLRSLQACQASVQICTPARQPRGDVGNDLPSRNHQADQLGLRTTHSAAHASPDRWHRPGRQL
jgi:hypothetical protein